MRHHTCLAALALLAGCAPIGTKPDRVAVSSDPTGADVYVMGTKLGTTPASIPLAAVFPPTYTSDAQRLYGTVELRHAGCAPVTQTVSTRAVARGVHVKLDCGPAKPPDAAAPAAEAAGPVDVPLAPEQRLRQLRDWLDQGLITEDEAADARRRILDAF